MSVIEQASSIARHTDVGRPPARMSDAGIVAHRAREAEDAQPTTRRGSLTLVVLLIVSAVGLIVSSPGTASLGGQLENFPYGP